MGDTLKKVNSAFERLRDRRSLVTSADSDISSEEALKESLRTAARTQDISALVRIIARSQILSPAEYVHRTIGSILFVYYTFVDNLHRDPRDLDDLIDGLLYLDAKSYSQKEALKRK